MSKTVFDCSFLFLLMNNRQRLRHIMEECEATAHYERSAALAIWHGDLRAAVNALRRGAEAASQRLNDDLDGDVGQPLEVSKNAAYS